MSEILARIRVRETHGIRRFLYPLIAYLERSDWSEVGSVSLFTPQEQKLPIQRTPAHKDAWLRERLDFAISLEPFEELELELRADTSPVDMDDPLSVTEEGGYHSRQQRFGISFLAGIDKVIYDGISHLRGRTTILRNGAEAAYRGGGYAYVQGYPLNARTESHQEYNDNIKAQTHLEITACKSWATITHSLEQPQPNDEIVFTLPLAITSSTLTCDFGVGGYVFGKLDANAPEIVWHTEFGDAPYAKWTVAAAGRLDYVGEVSSAEAFLPQRWFHLIDSDKALAVAITQLPDTCQSMTVRLTLAGDITIVFKLGGFPDAVAAFGVCYHFLNNVPAIAAATNPQSILLPPTVEVLPSDLTGWQE